ncbi:type VII secretion protein EsaA [Enterococcus ureasiticus]|uniref:Type VII secretion system accessory factor EsaA n=1 Tax=Enterococcus ureasiticus TaxID=903984 RepID=A0A1E5GCN2_9ENTE|nr:type VII secretion protein EsaA [Enterococcus ureasiticus]OEG10427.1 type VII secretion protein EsaA [Enterococcus ureasiticus]
MNSKKLYYMLKSVWMVVILLIMLIFMNRDFTDISANKAKEEQDMRLNIALVNEDNGINKNNIDYNLGSDYVKKIEKDATYNWFTVSRGIAENGLKNGTYNLLVTIPSNFSSKLLELDSEAPEKVQVNYKINANGNATLENESRSVGRRIVNDLNQQLVDLYVVSIVDNLYTAQQNIEKVYTNQTDSVGKFQDILYQPTINFKDYLPGITSQSQSALQANDLLTNTLVDFIKNPESLVSSHQDFSTLLEQLLKQRADGKLSYEEFVKILTSMDDSVLSSETSKLYSTLESLNQSLQDDFIASDDGNGRYIEQMNALNEQLVASKADVEKQIDELEGIEDKYFDTYSKEFFKQFRVTNPDEVTFKDVLTKMDYDSGQLSTVSTFNKNYLDNMQKRLDSLPFKQDTRDINEFNELFMYDYSPYIKNPAIDKIRTSMYKSGGILEYIEEINQQIRDTNEKYPENTPIDELVWKVDSETLRDSIYHKDLRTAYDRLVNRRNFAHAASKSFTIETTNYKDIGSITFGEFPTGIESVTYGYQGIIVEPETPIQIERNSKITFNYTFTSDFDETQPVPEFSITAKVVVPSVVGESAPITKTTPSFKVTPKIEEATTEETKTSDTEEGQTTDTQIETNSQVEEAPQVENYNTRASNGEYIATWTQKADVSAFLSESYLEANRQYAEQLGRNIELYQTVNAELKNFNKYPFDVFNNLLDMNMTEMFKQVLNGTFTTGHYKDQHEKLVALRRQADDIDRQSERIGEKLQDIQGNTMSLNENVKSHLAQIADWQKTMTEATTSETKVASDNTATDTEISAIDSMLKTIKQQAEMLKDASDMNVKEAESVKSVFTSFDKDVQTAQKNGEDLSANADIIMDNLNKELANNNDFVSAFIKVLNNAHKDGVPNNTLLQFIANPVNGKSEATIKTTEVNEPFTWILIMYTLSLFVAYLFATQPVARKVKNKFKKEKLWLKDNMLETLLLSLSAIGIGLILSMLSISELSIVKESQIVWGMMVVLFMLIFSLLNHYAMKQFHIAGFALSLFLFISYVFVTNAIGKTKGNNPMVDLIRSINPLSIGENNLADILANNALNIVQIILYLLAIAALIVFNIFIWKPKRKAKEVMSK